MRIGSWGVQHSGFARGVSQKLHTSQELRAAVTALTAIAAERVLRPRELRQTPIIMSTGEDIKRFSLVTWNIRGVSDRWAERRPLLQQALADIDADVVCFQEVLTGEYGQDKDLLGPAYHVFCCKAALFNLLSRDHNGASTGLHLCARVAAAAAGVGPLCAAMRAAPAAVEAFRERFNLGGAVFRTLRDLTLLPFFGNSLACRLAEAHEIKHSTLVLGDWRAAQRMEFEIGEGPGRLLLYVVNAHLDHDHQDNRQRQARARGSGAAAGQLRRGGAARRARRRRRALVGWPRPRAERHSPAALPRRAQAAEVVDWMEAEKAECAAIVFCGDFNGGPAEPFHAALRARGYRSAHAAAHGGREPGYTWPTGIQAPLMDRGPAECLDYIYVWSAKARGRALAGGRGGRGRVEGGVPRSARPVAVPGYDVKVVDATVHGLAPAPHDKTLFPSDHAAVQATLEVRRRPMQPPRRTRAAAAGSGGDSA
eukprot:scaffold7.g3752.t1